MAGTRLNATCNRGLARRCAAMRWPWLLLCLGLLSGCVSQTVKTVDTTPPIQAQEQIPEDQLLDVGIHTFDPNIPEQWSEREEAGIVPEVRRAEARFMPQVLKDTLTGTGHWGAVRVLPRPTRAVDVTVNGTILESTGEMLRLQVAVTDATGRQWFDREYRYQASHYAYQETAPSGMDPFQMLYNEIANDMVRYRQRNLKVADIKRLREIGRMRFAREFSPDAFSGYIEQEDGRYRLQRLPAENDPMMARINRIREREYLFIDTLEDHYGQFFGAMDTPYTEYRRNSYEEAVALREMEQSAANRTLFGALAVAGGLYAASQSDSSLGRNIGQLGILGGAYMIKDGLDRREEAKIHAVTLNELARSLEQEITPSVIRLEDRTVTLTGSVDSQYDQWKTILADLYHADQGLPSEPQ